MTRAESITERLEKLAGMLENGELTREEYEISKKAILNISRGTGSLGTPVVTNNYILEQDINAESRQETIRSRSNPDQPENISPKSYKSSTKQKYQPRTTNHAENKYDKNFNAINTAIAILMTVIIGGIGINIATQNSNNSQPSPVERELNALNRFLPLSKGKALYKTSTGKVDKFNISIYHRINENNHHVYDVVWSDGYESSYVFWQNGSAEIFSKDESGQRIKTLAKFKITNNEDCIIRVNSGATTILGKFRPRNNLY